MQFAGVSMKSTALALLALLVGAHAALDGPVDKVVTLLKELSTALNNDEKAEQATYDKYACWCEETTQRKAGAIETAKDDMKRLGQDILKQKGTVAIRTDEIDELQTSIKENEEAQESATTARGKENEAWQSESAETNQAMSAINAAMGVLMKGTKPGLLQVDATAKLQASVTAVVEAAPAKALAALEPEKLAKLRSFSQVRGKAGYAPQSMTIQGILSDMYTTMGVDLQDSTALEAKRNRAFEDYIAEKDKELRRLNKTLTKKQKEKAEAAAMLAEATEAYDDTSQQLEADVEFFDITKDACKEKTDEWKVRSDLRTDEIDGIDQALKILTSDDAKKLFASSIKPGMEKTMFLQVDQKKQISLDKLYNKLKERATESHSLRLAALAAQVRMAKAGHFDKVIKSIDDLIGVLAKEQDADTKKRDDCEEQYQDIAKESAKLKWKIKNNKAKIQKLENLIEKREKEKEQTIEDIKDTKKNLADMLKERTKENKEFKVAKKEDEDSVKLLKKAREVMMDFYKKNNVKMGEVQGSVKFAALPEPQKELNEAVELAKTETAKPAPVAETAKPAPVAPPAAKKEAAPAAPPATKPVAKATKPVKSETKTSFLQVDASPLEDPDKAPDATFSDKGKRKNQSKGVVSLLTMIIEDQEAEIVNEIKNEEAAQLSYEKAKAAAEKLLSDLEAKKASLEDAIAKRKKEKVDEEKDKKANEGDLKDQEDEKKSIETDCDYMIEKYEERRKYREAESEALSDAKEFLANYYDSADDASLVQSSSSAGVSFSHLASPHLRE